MVHSITPNTQIEYTLKMVAAQLGYRNMEHKPVATPRALCKD